MMLMYEFEILNETTACHAAIFSCVRALGRTYYFDNDEFLYGRDGQIIEKCYTEIWVINARSNTSDRTISDL